MATTDMRTLIVKVALSVEISVGLRWGEGILRSVLDWTVASERTWTRFFVTCPRTLTDRIADGLKTCESILAGGRLVGSGRYVVG